MNIVIYRQSIRNEIIEQFWEALRDVELKYLASDLNNYGLDYAGDIEDGVQRAIRICKAADIPIRPNFKPVYVSWDGHLVCDWRLSELGRKLVVLNANPSSPVVARLQLKLLGKD